MAQNVKVGLIQVSNPINDESVPVAEIQEAMFQKHLPFIERAGEEGVHGVRSTCEVGQCN